MERISFTVDPRVILLSLQIGFSFIRAAEACAILERLSGLELFAEVLDACNGTQRLSFNLYLPADGIGAVCHQFGLLRTDLHFIPCAGFFRLSTRTSSSCSSSASASMSSANRRLVLC